MAATPQQFLSRQLSAVESFPPVADLSRVPGTTLASLLCAGGSVTLYVCSRRFCWPTAVVKSSGEPVEIAAANLQRVNAGLRNEIRFYNIDQYLCASQHHHTINLEALLLTADVSL